MSARWDACGFTLVELLLVIAIISILAAALLPALSGAKAETRRIACSSNLKQLGVSVQMYAADFEGKLPENLPGAPNDTGRNPWVCGNVRFPQEATNQFLLRQGRIYPYVTDASLYHCPADNSRANGLARVRSYSMNGWVGSRYMEQYGRKVGYRTFLKDSELTSAKPASLWVLGDEHEKSIDDGFFLVTMDDSQPFASFPATRHKNGYSVAFADGHVTLYTLRDPESLSIDRSGPEPTGRISTKNPDWLRLKQITTHR